MPRVVGGVSRCGRFPLSRAIQAHVPPRLSLSCRGAWALGGADLQHRFDGFACQHVSNSVVNRCVRIVPHQPINRQLAGEDLQHYQLGHGEQEALTLTARLGSSAVMVTDDFLALIVANRMGVSCQLFLDFVVGRATRGELPAMEAQHIVRAVSPRYPSGFVPHSLAMLRRLP